MPSLSALAFADAFEFVPSAFATALEDAEPKRINESQHWILDTKPQQRFCQLLFLEGSLSMVFTLLLSYDIQGSCQQHENTRYNTNALHFKLRSQMLRVKYSGISNSRAAHQQFELNLGLEFRSNYFNVKVFRTSTI